MNHVRGRHVDTYPISMSIKSKAVRCGQTWFSGPRRRSSSSLCKRQLRLHYCTTLFRTRCGFNSAGHVRINTAMINDRRPSAELSRFLGRIFLRRGKGEPAFLAGGLNSTKKPKKTKIGRLRKVWRLCGRGNSGLSTPSLPGTRYSSLSVWQLSDVLEPRGQRADVYVLQSTALESGIHACLCM
jgi:hypothetical protein